MIELRSCVYGISTYIADTYERNVAAHQRLRYERFIDAIAFMGLQRFGHVHTIKNAKTHYHKKGAALFYMILDYMLPLAANVTAITYSQKNRSTSERRHTDVRSSQWMDRWRNIEVMREIMRTDKKVRASALLPTPPLFLTS